MSLRDRLEAKERRHHTHRVAVRDPEVAALRVQAAESELFVARMSPAGDQALVDEREAALATARAALDECYEAVEFVAMDPDEFDELTAAHFDEQTEHVDEASMVVALAAACAADESLRDQDWWREQLESRRWSAGERDDLFHALYLLNRTAPDHSEALGKG